MRPEADQFHTRAGGEFRARPAERREDAIADDADIDRSSTGSPNPREGQGRSRRRGYLIRGRVQGVGFRWWSRQTAADLGLAGTVRNRPDGRVELHVEGDPESLETMEARIQEGPPSARVDDVEPIEPAERLPDDFRIIR